MGVYFGEATIIIERCLLGLLVNWDFPIEGPTVNNKTFGWLISDLIIMTGGKS